MICPKCSHPNQDDLNFCRNCGGELAQNKCNNGHPIPAGLTDCPYCPQARTGGRDATVVEPHPSGFGEQPAGKPAGRARTMVASAGELKDSGVISGGGGGRGKTMFVMPDEGGGVDSSAPGAAADSGGRVGGAISSRGDSPLLGFLVSFDGDKNGVFWPLRYGNTTLGRDEECDAQLPNDGVSRTHCKITARFSNGKAHIWCTDSDTANGTLVNGEDIRAEKRYLAHNDVLTIGPYNLKVVLID